MKQGETLGLRLKYGTLTAYINGTRAGVMANNLTGDLVWAADVFHPGDSLRIACKDPP